MRGGFLGRGMDIRYGLINKIEAWEIPFDIEWNGLRGDSTDLKRAGWTIQVNKPYQAEHTKEWLFPIILTSPKGAFRLRGSASITGEVLYYPFNNQMGEQSVRFDCVITNSIKIENTLD